MNGWNALEERTRARHQTQKGDVGLEDNNIMGSIFLLNAEESTAKASSIEADDVATLLYNEDSLRSSNDDDD
jgi:hypothetical protein